MNRIVVYTCVTGDYDYTVDHVKSEGVDYKFFTDGKSIHENYERQEIPLAPWWEKVELRLGSRLDPRRRSKLPKIAPHLFPELAKYDFAIWIDGSMQIIDKNFPREILLNIGNGLVISPHFDGRKCALGEATIGTETPKYINEPLAEQAAAYRAEGFPDQFGLFEAGVMARDMRNKRVTHFNNAWLAQNMAWSYQDQVSFPYCMWKENFTPDILPKSWRDYNWLNISAHKSEA